MVRSFVKSVVLPVSAVLFVYIFIETGDTTVKMKNTHCMTLRLSPELDSIIADAAYDARLPKSGWIRLVIEKCLRQQQQRHEAVLR